MTLIIGLVVGTLGVWLGRGIRMGIRWRRQRYRPSYYSLTTQEVIGQLRRLDPSGMRPVYITAWFSDGEPITDHAVSIFIDDEDDVVISGAVHDG